MKLPLSEKAKNLNDLRKRVEAVTLEIFSLCGERAKMVRKIGGIKALRGIPVENMEVEQKLKAKVLEHCKEHGLDEDFCLTLLHVLLEESKRVQREAVKMH